jgi:hypothetical protein
MDGADRRFRIWMTVIIIVLGLSKHFNLPAAVTEVGRIFANRMGGYESRRWAQVFILLIVAIGLIFVIRWSARHKAFLSIWKRCAPEMICLCYLGSLVILRAISLHQIGSWLAAEAFGVRLNWIVELTGIYTLMVILLIRIFTRADRTGNVKNHDLRA